MVCTQKNSVFATIKDLDHPYLLDVQSIKNLFTREYRRAFERLSPMQLSLMHPCDYPPGRAHTGILELTKVTSPNSLILHRIKMELGDVITVNFYPLRKQGV